MMASFAVILPAAGKSTRFKDQHYKKPFVALDNRPVWLHSAEKFVNRKDVKQVIVVISPEDREMFNMKFAANVAIFGIEVIDGGAERADSVQNALEHVKDDIEFVAIHDAARPCIADKWIDDVFAAAQDTGAAILARPVSSTLKRVERSNIQETVSRDNIWEAQTPQVFRRELLMKAYAQRSGPCTDDAQVVEAAGHEVRAVPCSALNIKITTKEDLKFAQLAIKAVPKPDLLGNLHPFAHEEQDRWNQ